MNKEFNDDNLNQIWEGIGDSALIARQAALKVKELGVIDDENIKNMIINDLQANYESMREKMRKMLTENDELKAENRKLKILLKQAGVIL